MRACASAHARAHEGETQDAAVESRPQRRKAAALAMPEGQRRSGGHPQAIAAEAKALKTPAREEAEDGFGHGGARMTAASREAIADTSGHGAAAQRNGAAAQRPQEVAAGEGVAGRGEGGEGRGRTPPLNTPKNAPTEHRTRFLRTQWVEIPLPYYFTAGGMQARNGKQRQGESVGFTSVKTQCMLYIQMAFSICKWVAAGEQKLPPAYSSRKRADTTDCEQPPETQRSSPRRRPTPKEE